MKLNVHNVFETYKFPNIFGRLSIIDPYKWMFIQKRICFMTYNESIGGVEGGGLKSSLPFASVLLSKCEIPF